jgi:serine/threonine protein kinase
MSDPTQTFWKRLSASQLLSTSQLESAQRDYGGMAEGESPQEPREIAKALIRAKLLTPFQAKVLLKGVRLPLVWNDYRLTDAIEGGPFQHYYAVTHIPTGHELAIRLIPTGDWPTEVTPDQVRINLLNLRGVKQNHLLRAYELIETEKWFGLVTDRVVGQRLSERLGSQKRLSTSEASSCIFQVAQGLIAVHEHGKVHADIRPESIIEADDGKVLLWCDPFYTAVTFYQASGPALNDLFERSSYLAPELSVLQTEHNTLTDIYALGSVFFELLAGRPAFEGQTLSEVMKRHAEEKLDSLTHLGVEPAIDQIIIYMMAKRPDIRYQTAESVADQLSQYVGNQLAVAPPPPPSTAQLDFEKWIGGKPSGIQIPTPGGSPGSPATTILVDHDSTATSHNSPTRLIQARQRAKRRQKMIGMVLVGVLLIGGLIGGVGYLLRGGNSGTTEVTQGEGNPTATDGTQTHSEPSSINYDANAATPQIVIEDDGESLWESPTQGGPIELKQIPNTPRLLAILRPSDLLKQPEGGRLWNALGPEFNSATVEFETTLGVTFDQIEQLTISIHDAASSTQNYRPCYRIQLTAPIAESKLVSTWKTLPGAGEISEGMLETDSWAFWVAETATDSPGTVQTIVAGPQDLVAEAKQNANSAPTMQPDLRRIVQVVDVDRQFNLVFLSSNLSNPNSQNWMRGAWQPMWQPLQPVLMGGIQSGCFSFHLDTDLFIELTAKGQISQSPEQLAGYLEGALPTWQGQIEQGIASLPSNPYWEQVRLRYVTWVREGFLLSRVGVENKLAKVNAWLPGPAAHNLVAGTELALSTIAGPVTETTTDSGNDPAPETIADLLKQPIDFSVSSNDMINVMGDLQVSVRDRFKSLPFDFEIRLMGGDLREEGITQNQRISNFNMSNQPLSDILTGLVVTANPDKASTGPDDEKQKLLWVAVPDPDDETRTIVLITTRKAAVRNSYPLPEVFGGDGS